MGKKVLETMCLLTFLLIMSLGPSGITNAQNIKRPEYVPGEIMVKFKPEVKKRDVILLKKKFNLATIKIFKKIAIHHLRIPKYLTVKKATEWLRRNTLVQYAEPNYIRYLDAVPNDPRINELWGLNNTAQTGGTPGADIDALKAWDITTGSPDVVVAVIDSGIDLDHEDLAANLWTNFEEISGNGVDDDGNGYIDDVNGWDFRDNDNDPTGTGGACVGHGTHVAGTIGAVGNNGEGVVGVNWRVTIMPLRVFGPSLGIFCSATDADLIEAIEYYTDFGIRVSNNSWGGNSRNQAMEEAIRASQSVFVAAAGNGGIDGIGDNNNARPFYPSSYNLDNIIAVAATDHNDLKSRFSNFGSPSVDLGAPGENIFSTLLNDKYGTLSGTSMATPHVAGAIALLLADDPGLTNMEIKWRILKGTDPIGLRVFTGGRLNVYNSLMLISEVEINLIPMSPTIINPGNSSDYEVIVSNSGVAPKSVTAMVYARIPNGTEITLEGPLSLTLAPEESLNGTFTAAVPAYAPLGFYKVVGRIWTSGFADFDEDEEIYEVVPALSTSD